MWPAKAPVTRSTPLLHSHHKLLYHLSIHDNQHKQYTQCPIMLGIQVVLAIQIRSTCVAQSFLCSVPIFDSVLPKYKAASVVPNSCWKLRISVGSWSAHRFADETRHEYRLRRCVATRSEGRTNHRLFDFLNLRLVRSDGSKEKKQVDRGSTKSRRECLAIPRAWGARTWVATSKTKPKD